MIFALAFDLMTAYQQQAYMAYVGLYLSVACYAIAKLWNAVEFHILSHIILSGVHTMLILGQLD